LGAMMAGSGDRYQQGKDATASNGKLVPEGVEGRVPYKGPLAPFLYVPGVPQLNVARLLQMGFEVGCYVRDGTLLHVNRGLGTSGQRVRVGAPREISVLTLTAS